MEVRHQVYIPLHVMCLLTVDTLWWSSRVSNRSDLKPSRRREHDVQVGRPQLAATPQELRLLRVPPSPVHPRLAPTVGVRRRVLSAAASPRRRERGPATADVYDALQLSVQRDRRTDRQLDDVAGLHWEGGQTEHRQQRREAYVHCWVRTGQNK